MKKIITSLSIIAAVAAVVIGGTTAYFSDTETSTGNTFTAGAIDLKVDSQCSYNGQAGTQYCAGEWGQPVTGALGGLDITSEKFFTFTDLKPGDKGENTVSLHVDNNPAYVCAKIAIKKDLDVTCTEPEMANDEGCVGADLEGYAGEIAENLSLAWWADDGNNILQVGELPTLFYQSGTKLSQMLALGSNNTLYLTLADSDHNFFGETGPINGSTVKYFGIQWCFGDMTINPTTAEITCSGASVDNASQTDSLTGDLAFMAIQSRNNDGYQCTDSIKHPGGTQW